MNAVIDLRPDIVNMPAVRLDIKIRKVVAKAFALHIICDMDLEIMVWTPFLQQDSAH